jgi:hypothetical protein
MSDINLSSMVGLISFYYPFVFSNFEKSEKIFWNEAQKSA